MPKFIIHLVFFIMGPKNKEKLYIKASTNLKKFFTQKSKNMPARSNPWGRDLHENVTIHS